MTEPTQDLLADFDLAEVKYSTFWQRFFASLVDGVVLFPAVMIDNYNKTSWKSLPLLLVSFFITLAYKPFMEMRYKATLGKMALGLTIVNTNLENPSLSNILLRNIFDIALRIVIGISTLISFTSSGFENVDSVARYSQFSNATAGAVWIIFILVLISVVDVIFLIADSKRRALHDRIGQTLVVQKQ